MSDVVDLALMNRLLDPASGLATSHVFGRLPEPPNLLALAIDVGLRTAGTQGPTTHDVAGAYGLNVKDAYARGVGEAVERFGLCPSSGDPVPSRVASRRELVSAGHRVARPEAWPGLPHPAENASIKWREAILHPSGLSLLVPSAWIDWPAATFQDDWEGTPSGAAAHRSMEAALQAAATELVERDAVMSAWMNEEPAGVELDLMTGRSGSSRETRELSRLVDAQPDVCKRVFRLPTCLGGVSAYIAWVYDTRVAGAGCSAGADESIAVLRALREAWQIHLSLKMAPDHTAAIEVSPRCRGYFGRGELRCRHWACGEGLLAMERWMAERQLVCPIESQAEVHVHVDIVQGLVDRGTTIAYVDLSPRLPAAVRDVGFVAVKALAAGLQPLILNEDETWAYVPSRITLADGRPRQFQPLI